MKILCIPKYRYGTNVKSSSTPPVASQTTLFWADKAEAKTTWPLATARCKGVAPQSSATIPD